MFAGSGPFGYHFTIVRAFDRNLGKDFFSSIPTQPGIYRIFNGAGELIYVGKAKNLRRRLGQYRNAKRRKKHAKMRAIVQEAVRIELEVHASEYDAMRAETILIRDKRPKWNVAGAFYFLYPVMGFQLGEREASFLFTTEPTAVPAEELQGFTLHGAYRSRHLSGNAFFSLMSLLEYLGHRNKAKKFGKYSYVYAFRQVPKGTLAGLDAFLRGDTQDFLTTLILELVEKASARRRGEEVQAQLKDLARFWRHEARVLRNACQRAKAAYPVSQKERDLVLVDAKQALRMEKEKGPRKTRAFSGSEPKA